MSGARWNLAGDDVRRSGRTNGDCGRCVRLLRLVDVYRGAGRHAARSVWFTSLTIGEVVVPGVVRVTLGMIRGEIVRVWLVDRAPLAAEAGRIKVRATVIVESR